MNQVMGSIYGMTINVVLVVYAEEQCCLHWIPGSLANFSFLD